MKKLKIILLFSLIIYIIIYINNYKYKEANYVGIVKNIIYKEDKMTIQINNILINYDEIIDLNLGDTIKVSGELNIPKKTIFNQFNYGKYLLSNKIEYTLRADKIIKYKDNKNIFYKIKNFIIKRIETLNSSKYLKTFILGDKSELDNDMKSIYQENGISHLLAISGMHITLLASILKVFKKNILVSIILIFYAFLTGFTPSVIRAVSFYIFSKVNRRDLILIVGGLLLLYNPFYIYNTGFIFSFMISFFLIYFGKFNKNYFISLFKTSLLCFLASIPILINNFNYINIMSPIINLFFVPFISFILFPLSLLTLIFPFLDNILLFFTNILECTSNLSNYININIVLCDVPFYISLLYYIVIILSIKKNKYLILILMIFIHTNIRILNGNYITMIDVGQGDSILLELGNKNILIDTGGLINSNYSIAKNKIIPYLKSLGIKSLDYLIITHGDNDHIGESINLIDNFKVDKVLLNSGNDNNLEKNLMEFLNKKNIQYKNISKYNLEINNYDLNFINNIDSNENEDSLIIYTVIDNLHILLMGDAGKPSENRLIDEYKSLKVDILKVGHHGSKNSSSEEFIKFIEPTTALISVGLKNRFNHPNKQTIDILNDNNVTTYMTSINGSVRINLKNNKIYTCY